VEGWSSIHNFQLIFMVIVEMFPSVIWLWTKIYAIDFPLWNAVAETSQVKSTKQGRGIWWHYDQLPKK